MVMDIFRFISAWPNGDPYTFVFNVEQGRLDTNEWPGYFGEAGVTFERPVGTQVAIYRNSYADIHPDP